MAAHAMRLPRRRRWPKRVLAFFATVAFLGSGVLIAYMVMPEKDTPAPPANPGAAAKGAAPKAKPGLTKAQKQARHAAVAKLSAEGYEPVRLADWRPGPKLKVLVGTTDSGAMRAFFFSGAQFVGHDDPATSTNLRVANSTKDSVTLAYKLSTGGAEKVRFELQDGKIVATGGTIPPSSIR
jgi:LppP/LprE lipoprotein